MALQILPSFGGVAVTLARPQGFASRAAEKRRKFRLFSGKRRKEEGGRRKFGQGSAGRNPAPESTGACAEQAQRRPQYRGAKAAEERLRRLMN